MAEIAFLDVYCMINFFGACVLTVCTACNMVLE
jgi:hypothetical protein